MTNKHKPAFGNNYSAAILIFVLSILSATSFGQSQDGKYYTPITPPYSWVSGWFKTNLNIPKVRATSGRDSGALAYSNFGLQFFTGSYWRGLVDTIYFHNDSLKYRIGATVFNLGKIAGGSTDSSIYATRSWVASNYQPLANYLQTGSNGLTASGTNVKLGGTLTENTNINIGIVGSSPKSFSVQTNGDGPQFSLNPEDIGYQGVRLSNAANQGMIVDTGSAYLWAGTAVSSISRFNANNYGAHIETDNGLFLRKRPNFFYSNITNTVYDKTTADTTNKLLVINPTTGLISRYTGPWPFPSDISGKLNISDTAGMLSPYLRSNVAAATYQPIGDYLTGTSLKDSLDLNGVQSITLNTSGVIHGNVNFTRSGRGFTGTMSLLSQTANTFLGAPNGSNGTPTFRALADADIPSASKGVQWTGKDSSIALGSVVNGYHEFVQFITQPYNSNFRPYGNATSGAGTFTQGTEFVTLSTSTSSTSGAAIAPVGGSGGTGPVWGNYLASDYTVFSTYVRIPTLSDGTQTFYIAAGLGASPSNGGVNDGVMFIYSTAGTTGGSGQTYWQTLTANASSRTYNQNHTQTTVNANTWYKLTIAVNTSQALFYINNSLVATHTTNILSSATAFSPMVRIIKTNGTTARTCDVWYISLDKKYSTPL